MMGVSQTEEMATATGSRQPVHRVAASHNPETLRGSFFSIARRDGSYSARDPARDPPDREPDLVGL